MSNFCDSQLISSPTTTEAQKKKAFKALEKRKERCVTRGRGRERERVREREGRRGEERKCVGGLGKFL